MKKILLFLMSITLLFVITGCKGKKALTADEFKNKMIDEVLSAFEIKRSLSKKGCPYDNAVAEATYKIIKTEFAFNRVFKNLEELNKELRNYVLWYNYKRIHSTLEYMTPVEYRLASITE